MSMQWHTRISTVYIEIMPTIFRSRLILHAIWLLVLPGWLVACDSSPTPQTSSEQLPEHLIERFDELEFRSMETRSKFDAVFVDDHLRVITERLDNDTASAQNLYLYYEGEPVFFRSRGYWHANDTPHRIDAWAEFALNGETIGMAKHLDGNSIPLPSDEADAIRLRARELRETARTAQRPASCDFNKTLRHDDALVTVIVPIGDDCDRGTLRLYTRSNKGSTVRETNREGQVLGAWLDDFNRDDTAELLVSLATDDGETLRGWRLDNARFTAIDFGELTPAQQAGYGGDNNYRVEGQRLLRRYRSSNPQRGHVRMQYNWDNERWLARKQVSRDRLQERLAGRWATESDATFSLDIPVTGMLRISQPCGNLFYPVLVLPGQLLLTTAPTEAADACDAAELEWQPGVWLAEIAGNQLRLTGLTVDARFELGRRTEDAAIAEGSTSD